MKNFQKQHQVYSILFSCPSTFPLFHEMIIFLLRNSKGDWSLINPLVHTVSTLVGYSFSHEVKEMSKSKKIEI